jgi:hypothetical protein
MGALVVLQSSIKEYAHPPPKSGMIFYYYPSLADTQASTLSVSLYCVSITCCAFFILLRKFSFGFGFVFLSYSYTFFQMHFTIYKLRSTAEQRTDLDQIYIHW